MKALINGKKYRFIVNYFNCGKDFCFYIEAQHKQSRTHSYINNLNNFLSGLDIDINDPKVSDSQWVTTKKEANNFFTKTNDFLTDNSFRNYIERQLDLDRELGEWNRL